MRFKNKLQIIENEKRHIRFSSVLQGLISKLSVKNSVIDEKIIFIQSVYNVC